MIEFKGTKGKWEVTDSTYIDEEGKYAYNFFNIQFEEAKANAKLISKAPEMLSELQETLIDLKILRNQIAESNKIDHRWDGMADTIDRWICRKEQLIKEATTI